MNQIVLLQLRPTIDLKETLLHEMIHAYHFLLNIRDNDKSGHGDKFKEKMNFINRATSYDPQVCCRARHFPVWNPTSRMWLLCVLNFGDIHSK